MCVYIFDGERLTLHKNVSYCKMLTMTKVLFIASKKFALPLPSFDSNGLDVAYYFIQWIYSALIYYNIRASTT